MRSADLAVITALEKSGTFSGAARLLGVSHTTVSRKLADLEHHYGARLAERRDDGISLTPEGERLLVTARRIEGELMLLERDITGRDHSLSGHIKFTTVDVLAWLYMPVLSGFRAAHPQIELAVEIGTEVRNLSRREAEIALRATNNPDDHLYGRRLGQLDFYPYVRDGLEGGAGAVPWLEYGNRDCSQPASRWLRRTHPDIRPQVSVPTPLVMAQAVQSGLGAGLVPSRLADQMHGLRRLDDIPAFSIDIWLLTPMELRQTARIRALFDAFREDALHFDGDDRRLHACTA